LPTGHVRMAEKVGTQPKIHRTAHLAEVSDE